MSSVYRLRLTPGLPRVVPMTYRRNDVLTRVEAPKAQIWSKRSGGTLVANLTPYFQSGTDGTLVLSLTDTFTATLAGYVDAELWWDAYGVVDGLPVALIAPSPVLVGARVTPAVAT